MSYQTTLGEYRVGKSFNPSNNPKVDAIKAKAAALIDEIDTIKIDPNIIDIGEVARCKALAMTAVEDAAMWGVKAATKQARE